jgi:hypothetical protein
MLWLLAETQMQQNTKAERRQYQNPSLDTMLSKLFPSSRQHRSELNESFGRIIRRQAHNVILTITIVRNSEIALNQ